MDFYAPAPAASYAGEAGETAKTVYVQVSHKNRKELFSEGRGHVIPQSDSDRLNFEISTSRLVIGKGDYSYHTLQEGMSLKFTYGGVTHVVPLDTNKTMAPQSFYLYAAGYEYSISYKVDYKSSDVVVTAVGMHKSDGKLYARLWNQMDFSKLTLDLSYNEHRRQYW